MIRRSRWLGAALAALTSCHPLARGLHPGPREDAFRRPDLSRYAQYTDDGSDWSVERGVLVGRGRAIQSVLIRQHVELKDGWVEAVTDHADDGGLVLRFRGPEDYYLLAFRDDAAPDPRGRQNLAVYHKTRGHYREIWRRDLVWPRGSTRAVRFEASGPHLRVYLAGELIDSIKPSPRINDPRPYTGPGGIGVRHYGVDASWVTRFETLRWGHIPEEAVGDEE